ncbi:hypothetical protein JEQ12_020143 [Ovis aries]|uniref:Uncharacterized protein n=1 Tax=Ovis aries TaxID=9940 RepID=A0A836CP89_SHEEP|nr:hypothetical protein JEQ12_020143 [Ovis aries]
MPLLPRTPQQRARLEERTVASPLQEHSNRSCQLPERPRIPFLEPACHCAAATAGIPSLAFNDSCLRRGVPQRLEARGRRHHRLLLPTEKTTLCCLSKSCRSVCAHHCRQRRDSRSAVTPPNPPPAPPAPRSLGPPPSSVNMAAAAALPVRRLELPTAAARQRHPNVNGDSPA